MLSHGLFAVIVTCSCRWHCFFHPRGVQNSFNTCMVFDVNPPVMLMLSTMVSVLPSTSHRESGEPFESAWHASLTLLEPLDRAVWDDHKERVREFYRNTYRQ